jgi:hypothetical protein
MRATFKTSILAAAVAAVWAGGAGAVPTLQLGAPGATGEGVYANYTGTLTNPAENDTAVTGGTALYAAGAYKVQNSEYNIGAKVTAPVTVNGNTYLPDGNDWSTFGFDAAFDGLGAIVMATVPDGTLAAALAGLTIDGQTAFYSTATYESGFDVPNPPSNHAPIQGQDYLFFSVGNFAPLLNAADPLRLGGAGVPDFADESTSNQPGAIKELVLGFGTGFEPDWIHFDLFALVSELETDTTGQGQNRVTTYVISTMDPVGNPGSHDVTWKPGGGPGPEEIPEPTGLALLGIGLAGLASVVRRRRARG